LGEEECTLIDEMGLACLSMVLSASPGNHTVVFGVVKVGHWQLAVVKQASTASWPYCYKSW